jgi:hypothetical protein
VLASALRAALTDALRRGVSNSGNPAPATKRHQTAFKHRPAPGHNHYPKEIAVMVSTYSIPTSAPAQDAISRDFAQKDSRDGAVRRVTVCNSLRDIQGPDGRPMRAPQLLLRGRWLQKAGFHAGVPVKVHVSRGRLVIERDRDRAPQNEVLARIAQVTEGGLSKRDLDALIRRLKRDRIE